MIEKFINVIMTLTITCLVGGLLLNVINYEFSQTVLYGETFVHILLIVNLVTFLSSLIINSSNREKVQILLILNIISIFTLAGYLGARMD